jgi:hypothetical protein
VRPGVRIVIYIILCELIVLSSMVLLWVVL